MTLAVKERLMPVGEFLDWCPDGEKWELIGGIPVRIMAENGLHERVKSNVIGALSRKMRPPSICRPAVDGRQVWIDESTSYRPDASIDCAPLANPMDSMIQKPTVVFEVADTSLERDLIEKRANYFRNPHVEHVVIVDAQARRVHHFVRGDRAARVLASSDTLTFDGTITLDVDVAEFFEWLPEAA